MGPARRLVGASLLVISHSESGDVRASGGWASNANNAARLLSSATVAARTSREIQLTVVSGQSVIQA